MQAECSIISSISWEAVNVYQAFSLFFGRIKSLVDGHGSSLVTIPGSPRLGPSSFNSANLFLATFGPCTFSDRTIKVFLTVQFDKSFKLNGQMSRGSL